MNAEQNSNKSEKALRIGSVSTRRFWKIEYECWTGGYDGGDYSDVRIYWGTWWEAARECVKNDQSVSRPKWRRKVEPFDLPDTKRKRTPFYVC